MKLVSYASRTLPVLPRTLYCAALSLTALFGLKEATLYSNARPSHDYQPRLTSHEVKQRSLALCAGFSNFTRIVYEPQFHDETLVNTTEGRRHWPIWTTLCEADGKRYYIQINDTSGNLIYMMPETKLERHHDVGKTTTFIKTPTTAASLALNCLSEMRIVPAGTYVTLASDPQRVEEGEAWEVVWKVHPPKGALPYEVRLVMTCADGLPLMAVNRRELTRYKLD